MNHRILAGIFALSVLLAIAFGFVFLNTQSDFACKYFDCGSSYYYVDIVYPFTRQICPLALVFFVLIFVSREIFYSWFKVFVPFSAIALWLVINSATISGGWGVQIYPNRNEMTHYMVVFLSGFTILFVAAKYLHRFWKSRKSGIELNRHSSKEQSE